MCKKPPSNSPFRITHHFQKSLIILVCCLCNLTGYSQPFEIGHTTENIFDASRNRTIETEIYYPSNVNGDDVSVATGNFPVIVFGHGFVMIWSAYENFWEELVPKGYIMCFPTTEGGLLPNHADFGNDLRYIASAMQSENLNSESLFFNSIAPKTALMGHSMGGGASFLGAANNANITTLINFAAAETNPSAIAAAANVTVPTLIISGEDDCVVPEDTNQNLMYSDLASDCKTQVSIIDGGHCYYANSNFNCDLGEFTCNFSLDISRAQQQAITFSFLEPWLDFYLNDDIVAEANFNNLLESSNEINYTQSCATLSNYELASEDVIQLFPNPVKDFITLSIAENNLGGQLYMYNNTGQEVLQVKIEYRIFRLSVMQLPDGFYFLNYRQDSFSYSDTFIKKSDR